MVRHTETCQARIDKDCIFVTFFYKVSILFTYVYAKVS